MKQQKQKKKYRRMREKGGKGRGGYIKWIGRKLKKKYSGHVRFNLKIDK